MRKCLIELRAAMVEEYGPQSDDVGITISLPRDIYFQVLRDIGIFYGPQDRASSFYIRNFKFMGNEFIMEE